MFQPFITAVNSIHRIALAPIIVVSFGIGDKSKIVTSLIVVVARRSIDEGVTSAVHGNWASAKGRLTVVIPSTMAWVFASLSPVTALR
jgi:NitT/TauT family transport system permease protein